MGRVPIMVGNRVRDVLGPSFCVFGLIEIIFDLFEEIWEKNENYQTLGSKIPPNLAAVNIPIRS